MIKYNFEEENKISIVIIQENFIYENIEYIFTMKYKDQEGSNVNIEIITDLFDLTRENPNKNIIYNEINKFIIILQEDMEEYDIPDYIINKIVLYIEKQINDNRK